MKGRCGENMLGNACGLCSKYADDGDDDADDAADDDDDDDDVVVVVATTQETLFHPAILGSSSPSFHSPFALPDSET